MSGRNARAAQSLPAFQQSSGQYHRMTPNTSDQYDDPYRRPSANSQGSYYDSAPSEKLDYSRGQSRQEPDEKPRTLRVTNLGTNQFIYGNLVGVSPLNYPPSQGESEFYIIFEKLDPSSGEEIKQCVCSARRDETIGKDHIGIPKVPRVWANLVPGDRIQVERYNPFGKADLRYLGLLDVEVCPASTAPEMEFDQDELQQQFTKKFERQVLAPSQQILTDFGNFKLIIIVKKIQLVNLSPEQNSVESQPKMSHPSSRGILTRESQMNFASDPRYRVKFKPSKRRPAANAIFTPDFKFEDMGIGGLDKEFSAIFRRAFASRIFPPGLIESMGIQHVKGILLFGPPGTGKTLIARRIGKMLNAREPKVINGPEVLNKYVGQSEENIRKLFADAEKEYKEKGDESGLHIIIFDELDAVCKQRGSGAGGGTGVGDSVVNQLLAKLDGVDQLNNILLIGMTNRKDMIDDALLRPGRLEVHMEISLPDEHGRVQILKIHTSKMRESGNLDDDVNIEELAHLTKNFSGAEISGLVRSATSFALNRHVKVGTLAGVSKDVDTMTVNRDDFEHAFDDVKPAFGVSEDEMQRCLRGGIIHFSKAIDGILNEASLIVKQVQEPESTPLFSTILYGPPGSGKTALAAKIALDSGYPLIKMCSPDNMIGFNESMKIEHMRRIFDDAYKSPLSVVLIDNIERIVEWVPIGPRFSNGVLQALMVLLKKEPPKGRRLLVLATTGERSVLQQLDVFTSFDSDIAVPNVMGHAELSFIMKQSGVFSNPDRAIQELREMTRSDSVGVGIKKILLGIETAKQDRDREGRFAQTIARAKAQMNYS